MNEALKNKAMDFLKKYHTVHLATVTSDGQPMAHAVEYVVDNSPCLYFCTNKTSRKGVNIANNSNVGGAINNISDDWNSIQGLQIEGVATIVESQEEITKVMEIFVAKFPQMKNMPMNTDIAVYRVDIKHGYLLDYTLGFGHRDELIME